MSVGIKVDASDVLDRFDVLLDLTKNFKPFFKEVVGPKGGSVDWTIRGGLKKTFDMQEGPLGQKWELLTIKYAAWKNYEYPGQPIMRLTNSLYESLINSNAYSVFMMQSKRMFYGSGAPYAAAQHFGLPSRGLPARPYMGWRKGQSELVQLKLRQYILQAWTLKQMPAGGD